MGTACSASAQCVWPARPKPQAGLVKAKISNGVATSIARFKENG